MKRKIYNVLAVILAVVFAVSAVGFCVVLADYRRAAKLYEGAQDEYVVQNTFEPLKGEVDIDIDFEALISDNQEVVGWIYAPNTDVNYPVLQTKDNRKYLHKGLDGKYLRSGSIFMDYRNDELLSDRNYILYGHSMRNGSMFGALLKYK